MFSLTQSPLADAADPSPRVADAILAVFGSAEVQRHATEVRGKLMRLIEVAALRSEVAAAVLAIGTCSGKLTPAAVVGVLRQRAAALDDALDDARADRDAHEAVRRVRMAQMEPLRREISNRITRLTNERDHLDKMILARRRAAQMNLTGGNRHAALTAAGLTTEQIRSLGPECQSPEDQEAALKARIESIEAELVPLHAFAETGDSARLANLDFGGLVEAAFPGRAVKAAA
jgi:hypothetical protein